MENESFQSNSKIKEIHFNLIDELIVEHIGNDRHTDSFAEWKNAFGYKIADTEVHRQCSVLENFNYLKKRGLLDVGRYKTLREILCKNKRALSAIDLASKKIVDILESEGMQRSLLDDRPMTAAKILIEVEHGDIEVVKNLVTILQDILIESNKIFKSLSPTETGLKILSGKETDENYSDFTQTIDKAIETLGNLLLKYGEKNQSEKYSKIILRAFYHLLSSMEKDFGAKEFDIDWENYIVFTVKFASTREEAINENRENLKKEVKGYFDTIFENMNRCKGEERHRIIIY
eukprot:XP_011420276.1 PREDICTED: uncharacterized protein LOC105323030 isoform X2 [Crassostrea gigas]